MSIAGGAGGEVRTAMARVTQELDADDAETITSESVQVENGQGDRTIHGVEVVTKLSNEQDFVQGDTVQIGFDGGSYFGAVDSKPGAGTYQDETNYLGRYSGVWIMRMDFDSTNSEYVENMAVDLGQNRFLADDKITKVWKEGVTLTSALQSVRAYVNVAATSSIFLTTDFTYYYTER